jgi:F-type H+-transporting ATPase subunit a
MRLFGNVIGAFTIMELIKAIPVLKVGVPVVFSLYFDIFDGLLQAYIFVFLTAIYLQEAVEEPEEKAKSKEEKRLEKAAKKAAKAKNKNKKAVEISEAA